MRVAIPLLIPIVSSVKHFSVEYTENAVENKNVGPGFCFHGLPVMKTNPDDGNVYINDGSGKSVAYTLKYTIEQVSRESMLSISGSETIYSSKSDKCRLLNSNVTSQPWWTSNIHIESNLKGNNVIEEDLIKDLEVRSSDLDPTYEPPMWKELAGFGAAVLGVAAIALAGTACYNAMQTNKRKKIQALLEQNRV